MPDLNSLYNEIKASFASTYNHNVSPLPKSFLNILSKVLAGLMNSVYKYGNFTSKQIFLKTASFEPVTLADGTVIIPLVEVARKYGIGEQDRIKQAELEAQAKAQYYRDIGNAMGILSDLIGKDTAAGKALAVAQATINTFVGATEVLRAKSVLPEPAATISKVVNVAAIVASGIKSVKEILKTKVPGGGGGGGGGSAPSPSAIQAPIQAQLQTTTLNQSQIQQMGNAAVRSFVVESDVSGNQERIRRLNRAARIN